MRAKLTSRREVRVGLVASLLVAATLVLSGCWANIYKFPDGDRYITLTKDFSGRLITTCTADKGTGSARAFCVLDRINGVCFHIPETGITTTDCTELANYGDWEELDTAIKDIVAPGSHYECLAFDETADGTHNGWGAVGGIGFFGCQ